MGAVDRREFLRRAAIAAAAMGVAPDFGLLRPGRAAGAGGPIGELAAAVRGPVFTPGGAGYGGVRHGYNLRYDGNRPRAVVQPLDRDDVAAAIRWAAKYGERIAARSGGHSYAGYSTPAGGLVVDLRRMRALGMTGGRVRVGGGAQLIDVHAFLAGRGLTLPTGSCPSVGVSGLTLGGGHGLSTRHLGLTADRVRAIEVVTADGVARRAAPTSERDLYWALRGGGGGNFGIATAFEFAPYASSSASWFFIRWPWAQAATALAAWLAFAPHTDRRLTSLMTLSAAGALGVTALGQFYGPESQLRRLIRPLIRVSGASLSTGTSSNLELVRRWAGCLDRSEPACHTAGTRPGGQLPRERFAAASGYLDRLLTGPERRRLVKLVERRRSQGAGGALIFDAYGGAVNAVAPSATAFVHRAELCSVQAYAGFGAGGAPHANVWLASFRAAMADLGHGAAYQNYIDPNQPDWQRAYYGANLERLRAIRAQYDPDRVFAFPQGVA